MQWILRFRVCIIICLAVTLISAAVLFSVVRAVLPYATGYKLEIQQELSKQIGLPVEIESINAAIHWFSPRLKLLDVSVFDEKNKVPLFNFKEAFVELDVIASLLHADIIIADVGLIGADISIERLSDNEWLVQGIKFTSEGSDALPDKFMYMLLNSDYLLHDSNIYYQDHRAEKLNLSLLDINMDVDNSFGRHQIKFSMILPEDYGQSLVVIADLKGKISALDGDVYIDAQQLKLKNWDKRLNLQDQFSFDGTLDVNVWAKLKNNNIGSLITELSATNISIGNDATKKVWKKEFLSTNLRIIQKDERWSFSASDLSFGAMNKPDWQQPATILFSDDDGFYYLSADFLRLSGVQEIADLLLTDALLKEIDNIPRKIKSYKLQTDIYNLSLQLPKDMSEQNILDKLDVEVTFVDLSMVDSANDISVSGVDATVKYKQQHVDIALQSEDVSMEMKQLFREPLHADLLQGDIALDKDESGWHLKTDKLQLKNTHINSFSRLDLSVAENEDAFIDLQTDFYDAYGNAVSHYLPVAIMTPALIEWLDLAITDGYVPAGSFILYGDPGAFPYQNQEGVFQVLFSAKDLNMKFLEDWPMLNDMSAKLKFDNSSLIITDAKANTKAVRLYDGYVEILDLFDSHMTVEIKADAASDDMQSYIWSTPLELGDTLRLFQLKGQNRLNLTLAVPLVDDVIDVAVNGELEFKNTELYYPDFGYQLDDINGVLNFTNDSLFADSISAFINGRPASIEAITEQGDSGQQVAFKIDGVMDVDYLLQRYENIADFWLSGSSNFSIKIAGPITPKDYLLHIDVNSDLAGVVINLSDKVKKPAADKLAFSSKIVVLGDGYLRVNSSLIDYKSVSTEGETKKIVDTFGVRNAKKVWRVDVASRYMTGKLEFTEGLGKGTKAKLDLDEVDLHAMVASKNGRAKTGAPLLPTDFPPLDWKIKRVLWDNWEFTDVVVETDWHEQGMLINKFHLNGPEMTFDSRGTWLVSWNGSQETVMHGEIRSSDCGETLVGLGYLRSLDRCKFKSAFNSKWPAEPYKLSWANMTGDSKFKMKDGEIIEVDPGTGGRLLGLFNIFELANRLAFKFDDVTRKGFTFDTIKGDFEFVKGDGSLKDVNVSAAAADINIFGSIGMVKQDYGLLMRVKPHTDTLTFAGGALLGGVVIGAGLAIIQKVFDLGVIGHSVYSVTGTWDNPIIEKIIEERDETDEMGDEAGEDNF